MSKGPLWLRVVHRLERAVGEPVESAVRSRHVLRRGEQGHARHGARRRAPRRSLSRRGLHLLNLPAGSDVSRMREQLLRMERRLNQLTENVEELDDGRRGRGG